jgi:hypothetical protein
LLRNARAAFAAALIGSVAIVSTADAVPARGTGKPKTPKSATYKLNLAITQNTDWKYVKQVQPQCDWPETGEGEQQIDVFAFDEPARVRVTGKKVRVLKPKPVENAAHAVVVSEWDRKFSQISPCPGGGGSSGGDGRNQDVAGKDECLASGQVHLWVGNSRGQVYGTPGDPHRPKGEVKKGTIIARADPAWQPKSVDSYQSLPGYCSAEGHPNASLGLTDTRGEWGGGIIEVTARLPLRKMLNRKTRKLRVAGKRTLSYPNAIQKQQPQHVTTGKTRVDLRLNFRRIK